MTNEMPRYDTDDDDVIEADVDNAKTTTEKASIADLSALMTKTSDQAVSINTDTTVDWDTQDVDTDLYTYDTTNDDIDVLEAGDYQVEVGVSWTSATIAADDLLEVKIFVNGAAEWFLPMFVVNDSARFVIKHSAILKDLSVNDTIRVDVRTDSTSGSTVEGNAGFTRWAVARLG